VQIVFQILFYARVCVHSSALYSSRYMEITGVTQSPVMMLNMANI